MWLQSLDQEDPLDEEMALQYSSLGNTLENRAWQATVHGVTQGQTQLNTRARMHSDYLKKKNSNPIPNPQFNSSLVAQSYLTLYDPMNRSTPCLPVQHQLPESTQTHVH